MASTTKKAKLFNKEQYDLALAKSKDEKFIARYVEPFRAELELMKSACPIFIFADDEIEVYSSQRSLMEPNVKTWEANVIKYLQNSPNLRQSEYRIIDEAKNFPYRGFLTANNEILYLWHCLPIDFVVALRSLIDYHFETMVVERRSLNLSKRSFTGKSLKTKFLESKPKNLFSLQEIYPEPLPSMLLFSGKNLSYLDLNPEFGNNCIIASLLNLNYVGYSTEQLLPNVRFIATLEGEYDRVIFHPRHCNILFKDTDVVISPIEFIRKTITQCEQGWQHVKRNGIFSLEMESFHINGNGVEITSQVIEAINLFPNATFLGCSAYSTAKNRNPMAYGVWSWQKSSFVLPTNDIEVNDDHIAVTALGGIRSLIPNFILRSPVNIIGVSGFDSCPVALALFARRLKKTVTLISLIETPFTTMARRLGACVKIFDGFSESDLKNYLINQSKNFSTSVYPFQLASQQYLFSFTLPVIPTRLWLIYATGFTYRLIRSNYPNLPICAVNVHLINLPQINDSNLTIYSSEYPIEEQSLEFKLLKVYNNHKQQGDMYLL